MTAPDPVTQEDLHAYVDGRLEPADELRIEAWLAEHPEDAAAVHAYRLQNSRLHDEFDSILDQAIPPEMEAIVTGRPRGAARLPRPWMNMAASILLLLAGGMGGWLLHGTQGPPPQGPAGTFADVAMGAHRVFVAEVRHPVEVPATQEAHLVAWLSKRLGTKLRAPDLTDAGFSLVGGRLLAEGDLPAAQFMYEDSGGQRLTVYVRAADETGDTAFRFVAKDNVSAFYWMERAFAYALVAPMERTRLMAIAHKVYGDLSPR
ncbi:MAG: anti-sigma factor [Rhodospirillales bacterium]|nr:anti-sigma factor [Rhodospirillales bacterium]